MDVRLLSLDNFTLIRLPEPIVAYNVDGTKNLKGTIHWKAKTILTLEDHSDPIELVRNARPTQTYSFLPASWTGDTHEETDFLPIGNREEKEELTSKPSY